MQPRRISPRSLVVFISILCVILLLSSTVSAQDDSSDSNDDGYSEDSSESSDTRPSAAQDPNAMIPTPTTAFDMPPSGPAPDITSSAVPVDPMATNDSETAATTQKATRTKPPVLLPTIMYVPPIAPNINPNATDPFFPPGSESCQKCKYFYPKLKQCNQIANITLAKLPRAPDVSSTMPITAHFKGKSPSELATAEEQPSEFSTILPFLQCICPNQGLPATKVCLTCFRISSQRNFLDVLETQNVTKSLSAFQEACLDSGDGSFVPPAANKGQSASTVHTSGTSWTGEGLSSMNRLVLTGGMILLGGWSFL